jgi:two-component system cell cycle response regulator CtrA
VAFTILATRAKTMANYGKGRQPYLEWSEAERLTLYRLFANAPWPELLAALPGRTRQAIWQKGKCVEKLVRKINKRVPWNKAEIEALRRLYPVASDAELVKALPRHTLIAIQRQASSMRVLRPRAEAREHGRVVLSIIEQLYKARLAQHMRRPELADKLGYAVGQILAWELGKTNPEFRVVIDWAQALGFEIILRDPKEATADNIVLLHPKPKAAYDARDERIVELEELLGKTESRFDYTLIKLTKSEDEFASLFLKRGYWTRDGAFIVLYGARLDEAPEPKILDALLSRMRQKLEKFGITIDTQPGTGWSMTAENRAKLKALTISSIAAEALAG